MTDKPTVVEALSKVMEAVQAVRKGDRNQQQGYSFRGIDATVNAVGPALRKHGVIVVPHVVDVAYSTVEVGQKRTPMRECTVTVRYVFHGPAGDNIDCVSVGEAMDSGDKSTPKAMSVAFRVALLQALCIPTDEPDADAQAYERAPAVREPSRDERDQARRNFVANAGNAINQATTREKLDETRDRIGHAVDNGVIPESDAIELRRMAVARLDALFPADEQKPIAAPVDQRQHKRMHALWREVGLGGTEHRETRLTRTSLIVGRDVDSSAHLTAVEADKVIGVLEAERKRAQEPPQAEPVAEAFDQHKRGVHREGADQ